MLSDNTPFQENQGATHGIQEIQGNQGIPDIQAFQENSRNSRSQPGLYKKAMKALENYLELHRGERFDLDTICRHMEIRDSTKRDILTQCLAYKVKRGILEKNNRLYRYIDNTFTLVNWWDANTDDILDLTFPWDHIEGTKFGFQDTVDISPQSIIVIAGVSNAGKSAFCRNFVFENMDNYHCRYMVNEYQPGMFKRSINRMDWANPFKDDGSPKFDLIERYEDFVDIVDPDCINVIDWISLSDNFFQIGGILRGIKEKLRKGIALVSLQKDPNKPIGTGGQFSVHFPTLYLSIDFGKLTVIKAKEWRTPNPNGKMYGFDIIEHGSAFHNIREVKKCSKCFGSGIIKGDKCLQCIGRGFVDA